MDEPTTQQAGTTRDTDGKFLPGVSGNPTGQGGFADNPQNINAGGRPKNDQRFGYWLQFFKNLTMQELEDYLKSKPIKQMYVAEAIAFTRVERARKDLNEYREVADRTEGKSPQKLIHEGGFFSTNELTLIIKSGPKIDLENEPNSNGE